MLLEMKNIKLDEQPSQLCQHNIIIMRGLKTASYSMYILVLVVLNYYLPFSLLYSTFHTYDDLYKAVENANRIRSKKGRDYFSSLDSVSSVKFYQHQIQSSEILLAIGIISIKRSSSSKKHGSLGYLFQSSSSIDKIIKQDKAMGNSVAFVCNVDLYPKAHSDAQLVSQFMPYVERYGNNSLGLKQDLKLPNSNFSYKSIDRHANVYEKETYDYVFCLNAAAALKPRYVLLVEEDSVPHKDFPVVLDYFIHQCDHHQQMSFLKFYFPSKWQGFSLQLTEIIDLLSLSTLGATLYCLLSYSWLMRLGQYQYSNVRKDFPVAFVICMLSCYILGRQNINELRRASPSLYRFQSSEMCCTQAMLYTTRVVPNLSRFMLAQANTAHTDLLIWDFSFEENLPSYQIEPNLFHHTGLHSTLLMKQKHPEEFIFSE